jgi:hypothetical protein
VTIHLGRMLFQWNTEDIMLASSIFDNKHLDTVCRVLTGRGVFYIVEPYPQDQSRVFVKRGAIHWLRDLVDLTDRPYPFIEDVVLTPSLFKYAGFLPWHAKDGNYIMVEPKRVVHKLVSLVPPGREEDLSNWEQHFLNICRDAEERGICEVRFYLPDLAVGDEVTVPEPQDDDLYHFPFIGTVIGFRKDRKLTVVVDQDGDAIDIETDRLIRR